MTTCKTFIKLSGGFIRPTYLLLLNEVDVGSLTLLTHLTLRLCHLLEPDVLVVVGIKFSYVFLK